MTFNKISPITPNSFKGIGEYDEKNTNRKWKCKALCILKIACHILLGIASAAIITVTIIYPPLMIASIPLSIITCGFSSIKIQQLCCELKGIRHIAPSTHTLIPTEREREAPKLEDWNDKKMHCFLFKDCMRSFRFKKKLIENAEQEILISGSYCGRRAFDEILDAIEKRMDEKPDLRVHILTATRFVTEKEKFKSNNWTKIKLLTEKFPDRFFTVFSFETVQTTPGQSGYKYVSNHAKLMVVDRNAMITGGGGIEDRWAYSNGLEPCEPHQETGFVNASIAKTFRDKDFLFYRNDEEEGKSAIDRSVLELYKLFTRWHHFNETTKIHHQRLKEIREARKTKLEPFHNFYRDLQTDNALLTPHILLDSFNSDRSAKDCQRTKVFMSGPEQSVNEMEKELIQLIVNAKERIVINHMYFHPTKDVRNALKKAAQKGITIDILTNNFTPISPRGHKIFSPRSIFNARLIAKAQKKDQDNVNLYCWNIKNSTNHQKIIMIDGRYALFGSSNLGYKGLNSMSDYEHNILVDSPELCKSILADFEEDTQKHSKKLELKELRSFPGAFELFSTAIHYGFQSKIG